MMTLAGAALLVTGTALAQGSMGGGNSNAGSANSNATQQNQTMNQNAQMGQMGTDASSGAMQDKKFAKAAMAGGMAEIQMAQVALQKSSSDDVKQFAQKMIDDHGKLNDQMKPIAAQVGVEPPAGPDKKDMAELTKLQGLSGDAFDKEYIKNAVKDHSKDDKDFQMEASMGQNPQEKNAAQQGDQVVKMHLQMAQNLAKTHNVAMKGM
jgi:putative membrane protein